MTANEIIDDALKNYTAPDGLMRLEKTDSQPGYTMIDSETVANENGVLFQYRFYRIVWKTPTATLKIADVSAALNRAITLTTIVPGLYDRNPHNKGRDNAHDNYIAPAGFNISYARDIVNYGLMTDYTFNNLAPGTENLRLKFQGGDVAFVYMLARYQPSIVNFLWLLGGIIVNAFQPRNSPANNPSTTLLTWDRIDAIVDHIDFMPAWIRSTFKLTAWFWSWKLKKKYPGGIPEVNSVYYTDPGHPIRTLGELATWPDLAK